MKIRGYAKKSIGSLIQEKEETLRLILDSWIFEIRQINKSIKHIEIKMGSLVKMYKMCKKIVFFIDSFFHR